MSDPLVELERFAPKISAALDAMRLEKALGRTAEKLADVPRQTARFQALVEAANSLGVADDPNGKRSLSEAVEESENLGLLLEAAATPDDLQYLSDDFPKLLTALKSLDLIVRQFWRHTVTTEFQSLHAIGTVLVRISRTQDLGARLTSVGQEALSLSERNPPAEQLSADIHRLRQKRIQLETELHVLSGNPEVDAFLAAVARDVATLSHVTLAVLDWLRDHDAVDAFSIRGKA